jgi:POT family proton-dependent oligopeptide transporter
VCGFCFPIFFKHLDKPVDFNDMDRMEGRQQPVQTRAEESSVDEEKKP